MLQKYLKTLRSFEEKKINVFGFQKIEKKILNIHELNFMNIFELLLKIEKEFYHECFM